LMPGSHCRNEVGQDKGAQRIPSPDRRGGNAGECDLLTIAPHPKSTHCWLRYLVPSVKTGVPLNAFELDPELRCRVHIYKRQDEHQHQQPTTALLLPPLIPNKTNSPHVVTYPRHWHLLRNRQDLVASNLLPIDRQPRRAKQTRRWRMDQPTARLQPRRWQPACFHYLQQGERGEQTPRCCRRVG
jgi:hypothetical protein